MEKSNVRHRDNNTLWAYSLELCKCVEYILHNSSLYKKKEWIIKNCVVTSTIFDDQRQFFVILYCETPIKKNLLYTQRNCADTNANFINFLPKNRNETASPVVFIYSNSTILHTTIAIITIVITLKKKKNSEKIPLTNDTKILHNLRKWNKLWNRQVKKLDEANTVEVMVAFW